MKTAGIRLGMKVRWKNITWTVELVASKGFVLISSDCGVSQCVYCRELQKAE